MWAAVAARRQAQQLACALFTRSAAGGLEALGGFTRGVHRLPKDESLAAKRERRKQRRKNNRDLKEQVLSHGFGWQCKPQAPSKPPAAARARPGRARPAAKHTSTASSEDESDLEEDWQLFQAMLGHPRSATEKRQFTRAWQQWQAASVHERARGKSGMSAGGGSGTWGWEGAAAGGRSSSQGGASSSGGSGSGTSWKGSAGASAGPRWGQANWSWEDFGQEASSRRGGDATGSSWQSSGWEDEEAWYEAAPGARRGSTSSSRNTGGSAGDWHNAWQHFGSSGSGWHHSSGQHSGSSTGSSTGSGSSSGTVRSSRSHSSTRLLGLDPSWLSLRCGRQLKSAYLVQAKALHPDVHAGSGCARSAAAAEKKFKEVQAAYEELLALVARPAEAGQR